MTAKPELTVLTCLSGLCICSLEGINSTHSLGLLTMVVLGVSAAAGQSRVASSTAANVELLGYAATLLFHVLTSVTEICTRFPVDAPLFAGVDDPRLHRVLGVMTLGFVVVIVLQLRQAWKSSPAMRKLW